MTERPAVEPLKAAETAPPTRRRQRESAERSPRAVVAPRAAIPLSRSAVPRRAQRHPHPIRAALTLILVVPGLIGTLALPAFATNGDGTLHQSSAYAIAELQHLEVGDAVIAAPVLRDGYGATTAEELDAARAAKAAAAEQATRSANSGARASVYSPNDLLLLEYLASADTSWQKPIAASITSPYGPRGLVCNGAGCSNSFHDGVDFGSSCGTPIFAASAGRVTFIGAAGTYGNRVIVDHGNGIETIYGHLKTDSYTVAVGDLIARGTQVAGVGATGVVQGCHLDLKVRVWGEFTNPVDYFATRGVTL